MRIFTLIVAFTLFLISLNCSPSISVKKRDALLEEQNYTLQMNFYKNSTRVDSVDWVLINYIPPTDTDDVLMYSFIDEMGFSNNSIYCMAVFENSRKTEYKLVAPWLNSMIVQKSNLLVEKAVIVPKSKIRNFLK